jgi:hypothetical protein
LHFGFESASYIPPDCCGEVTSDEMAMAQTRLDILTSAILAGRLVFDPGMATLEAPDLAASLVQMFPSIFDAAGAATLAQLATRLAAAPVELSAPLSRLQIEQLAIIAAVAPGPAPGALVAGVGWQWFPPGFYIEFTNAVIAAAGAGQAVLTPLLVPIVGPQAAPILAAAMAAAVGAMKFAQWKSKRGAIKIKLIPQAPPLPPLILPWPA